MVDEGIVPAFTLLPCIICPFFLPITTNPPPGANTRIHIQNSKSALFDFDIDVYGI